MAHMVYERIESENLILRDLLAIDRTVLSNQRSFLACIRTSLSVFVAGVSFIKFIGYTWTTVIGWAFMPLSAALLLIGVSRYLHMKRRIEALIAAREGLEARRP